MKLRRETSISLCVFIIPFSVENRLRGNANIIFNKKFQLGTLDNKRQTGVYIDSSNFKNIQFLFTCDYIQIGFE